VKIAPSKPTVRLAVPLPPRTRASPRFLVLIRAAVSPGEWSGPIDWRLSRVGRYDLVRVERAEIEHWLGTAVDKLRSGAQAVAVGPELQAADAPPPLPATRPVGTAEMQRFVAEFVATENNPTELFREFNQQMGDAAPGRGRPGKSPNKSPK
jgi:hypothetical protein